jgi:hypothetical protein
MDLTEGEIMGMMEMMGDRVCVKRREEKGKCDLM